MKYLIGYDDRRCVRRYIDHVEQGYLSYGKTISTAVVFTLTEAEEHIEGQDRKDKIYPITKRALFEARLKGI